MPVEFFDDLVVHPDERVRRRQHVGGSQAPARHVRLSRPRQHGRR
jgi:hypothetical protein